MIQKVQGTHCIVSGRVQGVFFRASTQEVASNLGLGGWVKNRYDGAVELQACGAPESVKRLQEWLWQGPANAAVMDVVCKEINCDETDRLDDFIVTY